MKKLIKSLFILSLAAMIIVPSVSAASNNMMDTLKQFAKDYTKKYNQNNEIELNNLNRQMEEIKEIREKTKKKYDQNMDLLNKDMLNQFQLLKQKMKKATKKEDKMKYDYEIKLLEQRKEAITFRLNSKKDAMMSELELKQFLLKTKMKALEDNKEEQFNLLQRVFSVIESSQE